MAMTTPRAQALILLNAQERAIVEARYLAGSPEPVTFVVLGEQFGISKQRVKQVELTAFAKMSKALQGVDRGN